MRFDLARYLAFLRGLVSPPRLRHSIGVMRVMGDLAVIYRLDEREALEAGLLHAPVGAYLVARDLGIGEPVCGAIASHSHVECPGIGNRVLARCLRIADVLAPTRPWHGMARLREVAYAGRIEEATLLHAGWLIEHFASVGIPIHPGLVATFTTLSERLGVPPGFFAREEPEGDRQVPWAFSRAIPRIPPLRRAQAPATPAGRVA